VISKERRVAAFEQKEFTWTHTAAEHPFRRLSKECWNHSSPKLKLPYDHPLLTSPLLVTDTGIETRLVTKLLRNISLRVANLQQPTSRPSPAPHVFVYLSLRSRVSLSDPVMPLSRSASLRRAASSRF